MEENFVCLNCKKKLERQESILVCLKCNLQFPIVENIPVFTQKKNELTDFFDERTKKFGDSPLVYVNTQRHCQHNISRYNFNLRHRAFKKLIRLKNKRVLDIGCGTGNAAHFLLENNTLYGMDISLEMLKLSAGKGYRPLLLSVDEGLPFPDHFFDSILCLGVLPYFEPSEWREIFREFCRVLTGDGLLFLSSPSPGLIRRLPLWSRHRKKESRIKRIYTLKTALELLGTRAVVKQVYYLYFPFPLLRRSRTVRDSFLATNWLAQIEINR